jgi:hypothetical protein
MIDPKQIPDEAWEAAMKTDPRDGLRAAIAAALNAWPGTVDCGDGWIELPLLQEKVDD